MSILDDPIDPGPGWQRDHLVRYVETGGQEGHIWMGVPTLLLTVHDAPTGRATRTPLIYGRDGDRYLVVASAGGAPEHPMWYSRLADEPDVRVQVLDDVFNARAETAAGAERERLWQVMTGIWPAYDEYQTKTDRQIPVVTLTRA